MEQRMETDWQGPWGCQRQCKHGTGSLLRGSWKEKKPPTLGKNKAVPNFFTSVRESDNMETH